MEVILLKELRGRGGEGDVINVERGFANNYLLRQGYAIKATPGNLKQLEERRKNIAKREEVRLSDANALAEKLNGLEVVVEVQVGEEGQLFGSVTSPMIADAIIAEGIEIDRRRVELGKPIKAVGTFPVEVGIYRDIKATVNVVVKGEGTAKAEAKETEGAPEAEVVEDAVVDASEDAAEVIAENDVEGAAEKAPEDAPKEADA